ncbi:MAG: DUF1329 domain-containing protein [Gammaproteobacteria bacterium]|nr:MAG: DUF1329 domain-containing protein [Gammaproteobacteria bacterium]
MIKRYLLGSIVLFYSIGMANAAVSPEQAARLGKDLTPMGAEKAGNKDGTIPAWSGGITRPPAGYQQGQHHPDPFPDDKPLFSITGSNADQYKDKLTPGQLALLKKYSTYKMNIYQTRRTASFPQRIYDAIKRNATTAKLVNNGNGIADATEGIPFAIPQNGLEAIWNHIVRFRGNTVQRWIKQAAVTASGKYVLVSLQDEFDFLYAKPGVKFEDLNNLLLYFKQEVKSPARLAGGVLMVHETLNQVTEPRSAWVYNPGQRRVRRAPNVAYDNPGTASDGLRTSDDFDMYNGAPDRYNWKLLGKKEIYVPYNDYRVHSDKLEYADILAVGHLNPEYPRYELHRVWEVEATLKDGERHIYGRRVFYIDEDSWQILVADKYDNRGQIWRISEGHAINYYDVPILWTTLEVHHDLQSGRYLVLGLNNKERMYDFNIKRSPSDYTPSALRRAGRR